MMPALADGLWEPVVQKRFTEDSQHWVLDGLDGERAEIYRITIRHNNHAGTRDNVRLNLNGDRDPANYDAVEAYIGADYSAGDRPVFDGLARKSGRFARLRRRVGDALPDWDVLRLFDPDWRVLRGSDVRYMNFGKPLPGDNAVFGQGHLLVATGGTRSLIRQCAETHPKGNLLTVGRYTYTNTEDPITELHFSSGLPGGIGSGSAITIEAMRDGMGEARPSGPADGTRPAPGTRPEQAGPDLGHGSLQ